MIRNGYKLLATVALGAFVLGSLAACPSTDRAELRALHLSPDAPAVDLWRVGPDNRIHTNFSFTDSTSFRRINEGTYDLVVTPAGAQPDDGVLNIDDVQLDEDVFYTAVVFGLLADLQPLLLVEDFSQVPTGSVRVRVVHAAPGVGEVDVWNITDPEEPNALIENVSFGDASPYLLIPAGTYVIGLDVDGDETADLVFELPELEEGTVVNVFAVQDEDDDAFLLVQDRDGVTTRVDATPIVPDLGDDEIALRIVHLSPDAPAVDIWGPDVPLVTSLSFGEGTDYLTALATVDFIEIVPAGQPRDQAVLTVELPELEPGDFYTAVALGFLEELEVLLLTDDLTTPDSGDIRIRAIHAAAGVDPVDIWVARPDEDPIFAVEDLAFAEASDFLDVPAGNYSLGLDVGGEGLIDFVASLGDITAASIANVFAVLDDDELFFLVQENGVYVRVDATPQVPPVEPDEALPVAE